MQLKDAIYLALVASFALCTQAAHLPREHHLQRRQFGNDTAWTAWTSDAASTGSAPTSLDTAVAAADTASSSISSSSPSWFAWPSNATQAGPTATSLSLVFSSATFTYTMGVGPSKTVVTMTTVITSTFTNTLVCISLVSDYDHTQLSGKKTQLTLD
jgi:hypothetical protein